MSTKQNIPVRSGGYSSLDGIETDLASGAMQLLLMQPGKCTESNTYNV